MKHIATLIGFLALIVWSAATLLVTRPQPAATPAPTASFTATLPAPQDTPFPASESYGDVYQGEPGVVYWSDVPRDWKVCVNEARVYSSPAENPDWYLYSLTDETPVLVRELDSSRTFAMIQPAEYTLFANLCR